MYPFTEQFIKYNSLNKNSKIPILILDVKGNYYKYVKNLLIKYNLKNDLIEIGLNSKIKYNPLHKPNLKPSVLANRLKQFYYYSLKTIQNHSGLIKQNKF